MKKASLMAEVFSYRKMGKLCSSDTGRKTKAMENLPISDLMEPK
jgi:hypothetical protein